MTSTLDAAIDEVVDSGNCSGCGACTLLDPHLRMSVDESGFSRPTRVGDVEYAADAVARFAASCPGVLVRAQRPDSTRRHPTMGPVYASWEAWAADPEIRHRGSSGGALTALAAWLASTGEAHQVVGSRADQQDPRRSVSVSITSREEALASAGSRYAPVSNCANATALDGEGAFVGKPCEVSAMRALTLGDGASPLLLSFFCAGTPSAHATDDLLGTMGVPRSELVRELWYRGRGWPGRFSAVRADGSTVDASYDDSWGRHLGPAVQWRCKICPDGVGESSDITAADFWRSDSRGYPDFAEGDGISALIARTKRGYDVITRAIGDGVIIVAPMDIEDLASMQPLQQARRRTLAGRLVGARLAGARTPRYRGFGLVKLALPRLREVVRTARGTFRRVREKARNA